MPAINHNLKVVLTVDDSVYAYHTPISEQVFRANFKVLAATKAELFKHGLAHAINTGPSIAALTLMDEGTREAMDRGVDGDMGAADLLADLKRLTLVLAPTGEGWDTLPVDKAISDGHLTDEQWEELEATLVFFTSAYALAPRSKRAAAAESTAGVLNASVTSLSPTEWIASTRTSTKGETTEQPAAASSVPS